MLVVHIGAFSQIQDTLKRLDTIPTIPIEFHNQDSLEILNYNIVESFKLGDDSILIYNDIGSSIKLIYSNKERIEMAEIGIEHNAAIEMNLYSAAKDLKYTAFIDSLGTTNPYIILNWQSTGVWTSSLCFGNSGYTTNKTTKTQKGITIIDLKNSTIIFTGLISYSSSHTNISEGGLGGRCSRVSLNLDDNLLSIKHVASDSKSQLHEAIEIVGGSYRCPENNTLHFYDYEINENADYQLKNGLFVKIK